MSFASYLLLVCHLRVRHCFVHFKMMPFIFQVNLEYLESKLESVDGEEVQRIQENINSLFHHSVQALGEEHQIKVVNALQVTTGFRLHCVHACFISKQNLALCHRSSPFLLWQTLCALFRGVHQKNKSASGFDIINMLVGFDKAEQRMKVVSQSKMWKQKNLSCACTENV